MTRRYHKQWKDHAIIRKNTIQMLSHSAQDGTIPTICEIKVLMTHLF